MWADDKQLYHLYMYMIRRCYVSTTPNFHRYGGRGIIVCDRWLPQKPPGKGFRNFKEDMGPRPKGHSLDRTNNDGNYEPSNCKWVPRKQQYRNRCTNVWIEYAGRRMIVKDWARETGVREDRIMKRIRAGMPLGMALFAKNLKRRVPTEMISAAAAKKLAATHCKRGHELSGDNLHIYKNGDKFLARICRTCKRENMRARRHG